MAEIAVGLLRSAGFVAAFWSLAASGAACTSLISHPLDAGARDATAADAAVADAMEDAAVPDSEVTPDTGGPEPDGGLPDALPVIPCGAGVVFTSDDFDPASRAGTWMCGRIALTSGGSLVEVPGSSSGIVLKGEVRGSVSGVGNLCEVPGCGSGVVLRPAPFK